MTLKHLYKLNFLIINLNHIPEVEYMKLNKATSYNNNYEFFVSLFDEGFILIKQTDADDSDIVLKENSKIDFPVISNILTSIEKKHKVNNFIFHNNGEVIPKFKTFDWVL